MQTRTIENIQTEIAALKEELTKVRHSMPPQPVQDWELQTLEGPRKISDFFGEFDDLLLIHNMGAGCNYCTLWADGFTGYMRHIKNRCGFVLVSPDSPENQEKLAAARGWNFPMAQDADKAMTTAMGFYSEENGWYPGVSAIHRHADGTMTRTPSAEFGPGDDYCMVWPLFDLFPNGANGFEPH